MDSIIKKLACVRHPNEVVTQICTLPECQASSVLFCSKCQSSESAHYNQHKKNIVKIKDFLEAQVYAVDPPLVDELTQKVNELEQKLKKADDEYKKEDSQIDKDFGSLFAIFFKVTETGKTMLKTALREVFTKLVERNTAIRKNLESYKTNKVDLNELKKDLGQVTKDNAEDFFKGILGRRYQKYDVLKGNLSDLAAELEVGVKERPNYKKIPANQTQFEELKQDFEKACYNMINHLRNFVEIYGAKPVPVKKIDLSSLGKNQQAAAEPVHNASVARIAQDIERSNRNIFSKNPSMSQSQLVMSRDTSRTSIDFENLSPSKKFRSIAGFPEITNPKVVEVITKHLKVNYPENLQDEFIDFQTPLRNYKCLELPDVSVYQGQWRNNKRHGLGRIIYIDGGIYEGTWVDDVPSGFGRVIRRNGEMYEGDIKEYKAHGTGTYATLEGYRYSGGWVEDKKHGQGEEYKENSMFMYRGEFANNVYHGQGLLKLEDGRVFEGTFVDGKFTGKGSFFGPSSDEVQERYEGDFVDWKKHGKGVFELGDGSKYEGDFVNDLPEGYGEFTWPDGTISRGLWKNGKQDGVGEEISSSGTKREGEWVDGKWKRWIS